MIQRSESFGELMKALAVFREAMPPILKDAKGNRGKYATLSNVLEVIQEPLSKSGLVIAQWPVGESDLLTHICHHESQEWMQGTMTLPSGSTSQDQGGALTYGRRYALAAILQLRIEADDDDAEKASRKVQPKATAADKARKAADQAADTKPYKLIVDEIIGLKEKLRDVEPERGAAEKFVYSQKVALGLMTGDDLAANMDAGRTLVKNLTHQLDAWKEMAAVTAEDDGLGISEADLPPFGLTKASFKPQHLPLIREWAAAFGRPVDEFLAGWEDTADAAFEAATQWNAAKQKAAKPKL